METVAFQSCSCPRCGYDLSGLRTAFCTTQRVNDEAPVTHTSGVCSECGLSFVWDDVLHPERRDLRWLYDHASKGCWRPHIVRAILTLFATLLPWRFWRRVTIHSRINLFRLILWLPMLVLPLHALWSLALTAARWRYLNQAFYDKVPTIRGTEYETLLLNSWVFPYGQLTGSRSTGLGFVAARPDASAVIPLAITLVIPLLLLMLTRTRAASRVHPRHVLRAGVYGLGWAAWWYLFWSVTYSLRVLGEWHPSLQMPDVLGGVPLLARTYGLNPDIFANPRVWLGALWTTWIALWWWFALHRGLKLQHAGRLWVAAMLAALLIGVRLAMFDRTFLRFITGS